MLCEVLTNVMWSLAEQALGRPSSTPRARARLWDERSGRFLDEARHARRPLPPERVPFTWDTLAPLALPDLPEEIGRRLVDEVLLAPRFHDGVPPSVALDDPGVFRHAIPTGAYAATGAGPAGSTRRGWPGWGCGGWGVRGGGRRDGGTRAARTVLREGVREYYHPLTGAGMGATDFGWTAGASRWRSRGLSPLGAAMLDRDPEGPEVLPGDSASPGGR